MSVVDLKKDIIETLEKSNRELKEDNQELKEMLKQLLENQNNKT